MTTAIAKTDGLCRSMPFTLTRADEGSDGLTLEGHAAVFDTPTEINSWEGTFVESIKRGAFSKTIRETTPILQFDHGRHPLVGSIPIGSIKSLREDDQGLYVQARLSNNWLIQPVRDAIADGGITGMSFRFSVVREVWRDAAGKTVKPDELGQLLWSPGDRGPLQRTLTELKVQELGPVVWPAYSETDVGVRSREVISLLRENPDFRAELARALLTESGQPQQSGDVENVADERSEEDPTAPLGDEHPDESTSERADAPPDVDGHPSEKNDTTPTSSDIRRARMREIIALMGDVRASIEQK